MMVSLEGRVLSAEGRASVAAAQRSMRSSFCSFTIWGVGEGGRRVGMLLTTSSKLPVQVDFL